MAPIDALDVEAGFRLSLPLLELPRELSGMCRLGLNLEEDASARAMTGVTARIEQGRVISCHGGPRQEGQRLGGRHRRRLARHRDRAGREAGADRRRPLAGPRPCSTALHKTLFGVAGRLSR